MRAVPIDAHTDAQPSTHRPHAKRSAVATPTARGYVSAPTVARGPRYRDPNRPWPPRGRPPDARVCAATRALAPPARAAPPGGARPRSPAARHPAPKPGALGRRRFPQGNDPPVAPSGGAPDPEPAPVESPNGEAAEVPLQPPPRVPTAAPYRANPAAERYRSSLTTPAPTVPTPPQRVSSSGQSWAAPGSPSVHFQRAAALLAANGMDVHSVPPDELSAWLDELSRSGALAPAVEAAANEAATSAGARRDGAPGTLADFPIVAPLANPDVPRLCPVAVLRELRRPGDSSWHHAFACALLGAPAELSRPVAAFQPRPNRLDNAGTADSVQSLLQRDADNWWIVPVPPGAKAPPPSPLSLVAKTNGRGRLICDDSSRSRSGRIRGPNGACDTSRLPFPATVSIPGVAAWLRTAPSPAPGQSVFLMSWDITTAFRRIMLSAQARGAACVRWAGCTYRVTTCSMGSRWSSSAMNAIVHAVAKSLRRADGRARVVSYCDDTLGYMVGTRAEADAFRLSVIRRFSALGLPMAEAKCPPPSTLVQWIGLSISTAGPEATVGYAPALAGSLERELTSITVRGAVPAPSLRGLLGRLGWLACVAPPVGLWLRRLRQALAGAASGARFSRAAASGAVRLRDLFVRRVWPVSDVCRRAFPDKFPAVTLITDASSSHGGAVALATSSVANGVLHDGARGRGLLPTALTVEYDARVPASTRSELLTVVRVVHSMANALAGKSVRLFSDNMAALAASRGKASSASAHADDLGEALAALLLDNRIFLEALHIPGVENEAADLISRHDSVFSAKFAAGSATWAAGLRHAWERVAPTIRSARVDGIILRPRCERICATTARPDGSATIFPARP